MSKPPLPPLNKAPRYPVSSFGPELMAVLLKGATEVLVLKFPDVNKATYFQHRIHTLRSSMRKEGHPQAELVSRAKFRRIWGEKLFEYHKKPEYEEFKTDFKGHKCCHIIVQPNDIEFADILVEAGVEVKKPEVQVELPEASSIPSLESIETSVPAFEDPYKNYKE